MGKGVISEEYARTWRDEQMVCDKCGVVAGWCYHFGDGEFLAVSRKTYRNKPHMLQSALFVFILTLAIAWSLYSAYQEFF